MDAGRSRGVGRGEVMGYKTREWKGPLTSVLRWYPYPSVGDKSIMRNGTSLGYLIADVCLVALAYNPG